MFYEFSVSCQLTGAIVLLMWSFSKVSKSAIDMCFPGITAVDVDEEGNCILKKEKLQKNVRTIMLNVYAFVCITMGYLAGVFAQNDMEHLWEKVSIVCLLTSAMVFAGLKSTSYLSKAWFAEDVKVSKKALEKYDVIMPITEAELNALFEETLLEKCD